MRNRIFLLIAGLVFIVGILSAQEKQDILSPQRKQAIDSLALEKVKDLSKYISIIGDKKTPWSDAQRVIERAVELFMDGSEIGVSSLTRQEINYYKIREYFDRLMQLNYDKVNIEWYKIQLCQRLERQPMAPMWV